MDLMSGVQFTVPGEPKSKSRHKTGVRNGRVYHYKDAKTAGAQDLVAVLYRQARGPGVPGTGGFGVDCVFHFASRQRRDVDNCIKLVFDGLTGVAWADDSQVTEVHGRIVHDSDNPRTEVRVFPTEDYPDRLVAQCAHCGESFRTYNSWANRKYCTGECRKAATNLKRVRICKQCAQEFRSERSAAERPFCSVDCKVTSGRVAVTCAFCGASTTIAKSKNRNRPGNKSYCDETCREGYWREHRKVHARGVCEICGGSTSKKSYGQCMACFIGNKNHPPTGSD
jgi:Holliday junction resolvase RusA-like endonuclease